MSTETATKSSNANVNSNVLLIRHAEKETDGIHLNVVGQERAQAYVVYFQNYAIQGGDARPITLNHLFATKDSANSDRPAETIAPLANALGLQPDEKHKNSDFGKVAADILTNAKYANSNILICWHHGEILALAEALGVDPSQLPPSATWPKKWPDNVFGWVLQLCYDADGGLNTSQTTCRSQMLMDDDNGQSPPNGG